MAAFGTRTPAGGMTLTTVKNMTLAAEALLSSLGSEQGTATTAEFGIADHREWTYLPGSRPGLSLVDMTPEQRSLGLELMDAGFSAEGAKTARRVIATERIRRQMATGAEAVDGDRYWFRILGHPGGDEPWAWRVNGHHLAVHVTVVGDAFSVTPSFFGAEPARVLEGRHVGRRTLVDEEELARTLLADLDPRQRESAVIADEAPADILTRTDPMVAADHLTGGLLHADMSRGQQDVLRRLVRRYFDRAPAELADSCWGGVIAADPDAVRFAWAGPDRRGEGHYYRVSGPTFLIEYDNTQDNANHIHSVWRDVRNDWGADLLAAHYAESH